MSLWKIRPPILVDLQVNAEAPPISFRPAHGTRPVVMGGDVDEIAVVAELVSVLPGDVQGFTSRAEWHSL